MTLPQFDSERPFVADGGLETVLIFLDGIDLPEFAAFPLLDTEDGRAALARYYKHYLDIAARHGRGIVLDTPTWRANSDWGARLGYDAAQLDAINRRAVDFVRNACAPYTSVRAVVNGAVGPRGDGYVVDAAMTADEATRYHTPQARAFAAARADMMTGITMTYAAEAIGVARAGVEAGIPVAISFTVETDGRLPSGQPLNEAIEQTDAATGSSPVYYLVNCAHPTHFLHVIEAGQGAGWQARIKGIRANASKMSHAELDAAPELDRGDIDDLAQWYTHLARELDLCVVGGCCGTDHEHIDAIAAATARA